MSTASKEKIGVAIFGVFTLLFLFLGVGQMKKNINPWQRPRTAQDKSIQDIQKDLVRIDTDADGLSDIVEQTLYETSAFIPDTDSDGILDGVEIERGENPLCPFGQNCIRGSLGITLAEPGTELDFSGGVGKDKQGSMPATIAADDISVSQIRTLLVEAGAPKDQIDALSDEKLKELYKETTKSQQMSEEEKIVQAFLSQDAAQIREILKKQGVPDDVLNGVSDEELKKIFATAMQQGQ